MDWYRPEDRPLPWKEDKNIYYIWVSEIMLQQTRTEQVRPYYQRFFNHFPDLETLAKADESEVLHFWQGMGYYNRARNLHRAAQQIYFELDSKFPEDYQSWLQLPGVGPYTAAAVTSFAFNQPNAVLDGNVYRVLSRFFGIDTPIDSSEGKKLFTELASVLLDRHQAGVYNQAIMDFGATLCKPRNPHCDICPIQNHCSAFSDQTMHQLPVKEKKIKKKNLQLIYLHLTDGHSVFIQKRPSEGIWPGLYEFPNFDQLHQLEEVIRNIIPKQKIQLKKSATIRHQLTHRNIQAFFYMVELKDLIIEKNSEWMLVKNENLTNFAFHQLMIKYFRIFNH